MELQTKVSDVSVTGSEIFIYTIFMAFTNPDEFIENGKLVIDFPKTISYTLPQETYPITTITETYIEETQSTQVTFNLSPMFTGSSFYIDVSCYFTGGRKNNDTYTNVITFYDDTTLLLSSIAETVTLILVENFSMSKYPLEGTVVNIGDVITYCLQIENYGDKGATISKVTITDTLPEGLSPVTSFTPIGNELVIDEFSDPTSNNVEGYWLDNTMYFTLPTYSGTAYEILFQVLVDSTVKEGQDIINEAYWSVEGVSKNTAINSISVYQEITSVNGWVSAPTEASIDSEYQYFVNGINTGTLSVETYEIETQIPDEVDITKLNFFMYDGIATEYSISIVTSESDDEIEIASKLTTASETIDISKYLLDEYRLKTVKVTLLNMVGQSSIVTLSLQGALNSTGVLNQVLNLNGSIVASNSTEVLTMNFSSSTVLSGLAYLNIEKSVVPELSAYYPLLEIYIVEKVIASKTSIPDLVFADLLPDGLIVSNSETYYTYKDYFSSTTYDSRNDDFPIDLPLVEIIDDYKNTGRTLVRHSFSGFILNYNDELTVNFPVIISLDAEQTIINYSYLGNFGLSTKVIGNEYIDVLDLDNDSITTGETIAVSNPVEITVLSVSAFSIEKLVKGSLDREYSQAGTTIAGETATYKLEITNNQETQLEKLEIIDILPYIGDTGVIIDTERNSEFAVYLSNIATAEITNILDKSIVETTDIYIEYSTSYDPIRFNYLGETIGTGQWTSTIPTDITTVKAIKITTGDSLILNPYDKLSIDIEVTTPYDVSENKVAYNSFGVKGSVINTETGEITSLLPTEPIAVSLEIVENDLSSIGGFVWLDSTEDGLFDDTEIGINNTTVELLNSSKEVISTTITTNDINRNAGYYRFSNLEEGSYYVMFTPQEEYKLTIQQSDELNGSTPDENTGLTNEIALNSNEDITWIGAGLIDTTDVSDRYQAISNLINSVSKEESAISLILKSEYEKLNTLINNFDLTPEELIEANTSVEKTVSTLIYLEMILKEKLALFNKSY